MSERPPVAAAMDIRKLEYLDGTVHYINGPVLHQTVRFSIPKAMTNEKRIKPYFDWINSASIGKLEIITWRETTLGEKVSPVERWILDGCFCQSASIDGYTFDGEDDSVLELSVRFGKIHYENFETDWKTSHQVDWTTEKRGIELKKFVSKPAEPDEDPYDDDTYDLWEFFDEGYFEDGEEGVMTP